MTAFHLLGNRVERQVQFVEHMKISVCRAVGAKIAINVLTWHCLLVILVILIIEIEKV